MFRRLLNRYWPVLAVAASTVVALGLHVLWYRAGATGGEVVSGFGAALVAISVAIVGGALLTPGALARATAGAVPQDFRMFFRAHDPEAGPRRDAMIADTRRGIIVERLVIGAVVLIGTILNGYGSAIAWLLDLRR